MSCVLLISLLLVSCIYLVKANDCFVYSFENADNGFSNDKGMCVGMSSWTVGNYSLSGIETPNASSNLFVSPTSALSCGSSFNFVMNAGGTVEVNLYMDSATTNMFTVLAMQVVPGGNDAVAGTYTLNPLAANFVIGWQTLSFNVLSTDTFEGYITILGMASEDTSVLVDSLRYIPPGIGKDSCLIYDDDGTYYSTTEDTVTEPIDEVEDCVTYNFETDFDIRFTTDNYLCEGFVSWHLDNYTSIDIDSPNPLSTVFMSPKEAPSCISSFVFKMAPEGIIEANVFMEPVSALDHIIVLAQKVTEKDYDTVAGFKMYHPENQVFVAGWNVLRFSLLDLASFEGYLIFIGSAEKDSTVLVDSVRYIPPQTPPEDSSCALY